jgi:hypothetical protein
MITTGWTNEPPEEDAAPGGFAGLIASVRPDPEEGRTLGQVLGRAMRPDKPDVHRDPDETMANLMARGYAPGQLSDLARRLADAQGELAAVEERNERAVRRRERVAQDHAAGRITAFDIMRMDLDEPDAHRARMLAQRCDQLRQQLEDVTMTITPGPQRAPDALEAASRRARQAGHEAFRAATQEAIRGTRRAPRERRPFASGGGAGAPDCPDCQAAGASRSESARIHAGEITRVTDGTSYGQPSSLYTGEIVR